jgi:hypothetical protein
VTPATTEINPAASSGRRIARLRPGAPGTASSGSRPPLFVTRDDLFFYTAKWQDGERESAEARERGELRTFNSGRELLDWLKSPED